MFGKKKKNKRLKMGVAFSGGTALGIAHIGVIKALRENKIPIDCVSGTSVGAIAAVCLAFGVPLQKIMEISRKMNWKSISEFGYSRMGLNSNRLIGKIMVEALGDLDMENAKIPLAIVAVEIDTGKKFVFRKGKVSEAVMASTCLPGLFVPVEVGGKKLVDGGLMENLPLSPLRKMGAQIKIGVDLRYKRKYKKTRNVFDVVSNSYEILADAQKFLIPGQAEIIIEPDLGKFNSDDFNNFDILLEKGYEAANAMMPEIKRRIAQKSLKQKSFFQKISDFFKQSE